MIRKITAMFIAAIMLCSPLMAFAEKSEVIYNITFEDGFLGIAPSGFSVSESGNSIKTVELDKGYNGQSQRCISFDMSNDVSAGNSCYIQRSITEKKADNYVLEWWYYPGDTVTNKQVYFGNRKTGSAAAGVTFTKDGYIILPADNNHIVSAYEADVWYNVQLIFNTYMQKFDFYLNGELKIEGCTSPVEGMPSFLRFTKMYSAKKVSTTYLDSIRVYTGSALISDSDFPVPERTRGYADFYNMADGEVYMNDTFEEQFPYTTHANYYNTRNGNYASLEPTEEGNVIKVASTETAADKNMHIEKLMKIFQGKVVLDISIKPLETVSRLDLYVKDASGAQITPFTFNGGYLYSGSKKIREYEAGQWYRMVCMYDIDKKTANYFVNGERFGSENQSFTFSNIRTFRLYFRYETEALYHIDNIRVYGGDKIIEEFPEKELDYNFRAVTPELSGDKLQNAAVLMIDSENAWVNGEKVQIDENNKAVTPVIRNNRTLVPVRFLSENMGADVSYNDADKKIIVRKYNKTLEMTPGRMKAFKNGEEVTLLTAPEIIENRAFLPLRDVADFLEKEIFWNDMGFIVVGDNAEKLDYGTDTELIHNLVGAILYERPTPEKIYEDIIKNKPGKSHPRVMITNDQVELLKKIYNEGIDARGKRYIGDALSQADSYVDSSLPEFKRASNDVASTLRNRFGSLSLAFLLTGEEKYKNEVWRVFKHMSEYENWLPEGGIYFGELLTGVAIAYDWLYDYWTEEERAFMRSKIAEKAFPDMIINLKQAAMNISSWAKKNDNFNAVGSTGIMFLCMAVMDEEELSKDASWCASIILRCIEHSICEVMPDGAWLEGVTYWSYTMRFAIPLMYSMINTYGTHYGLFDTPGFKETCDFLVYPQGPTGIFNFHDAPYARRTGVEMHAVSYITGNFDYPAINLMYKEMDNGKGSWLEVIFYTPIDTDNYEVTMPYDKYFRRVEIAALRSSWEHDANYIAFHGGAVGGPHSEFDTGTFVIDSQGERWFYDLGPDSYSLTDYNTVSQNFRHYRRRAEGHNTLVFNPSEDAGQIMGSNTIIEPVTLNEEDRALAVLDMTEAYKHQNVKSVKRGIGLIENRTRFIIRDEIETFYNSEIYSFFHTDALVTISQDGKEAMLSKNGKQMRVRVLEDGVTIGVMDAVPLPTSPESPNQNKNEGMRKLYINNKDVKNITYTVVIDPITDKNKTFTAPEVLPLDMWR